MYLTTKLMVAIILVGILALKAFAGELPKLKLVPHSTEQALIVIDNPETTISELSIEDLNGDILYYKEGSINGKIYSKLFDFKQLSDGDYKVIVANKFGKVEAPFKVEDSEIYVVDNLAAIEPFFKLEGDVLKLSYLNPKLNKINFSISNSEGELFTKALGEDFSITAGFKLSKLTRGDYSASISDGKNTFNYTFEK